MRYYLGLDNGGTRTKACIYTKEGEEISSASCSTSMFARQPGYAEIDMQQMQETNYRVIKEVLEKSKINAKDIVGISVCGHGKGLYLVNKQGKPARYGILSSDNRAWEYPLKWKADGTAEKVYGKTFQQIMAPQAVCLLAYLKDTEPKSLENLGWIFECKDYIRFILTGKAYAELTDYSGANLVNLNTKQYDKDLLRLFDLEQFFLNLPPLVSSTDFCGAITEDVARITGLEPGTPVYGGMFDIDACAIALQVTDEQPICMIGGTWSINEFLSKKPIGDHTVAMTSIFCDTAYYLEEESSPTSAVNLEWCVKTLLQEFTQDCKQKGKDVYQELDTWIERIADDDSYPLYFPFIMASNVHPNAKACFIGLSYYHTRPHLLKSVFEGVAFSHRYHLEKLLQGKSTKTPNIRLAGGVVNSRPWVQMFADVMHFPIEVVSVKETGTLGCAMNIGVATGDYENYQQAAQAMVKVGKIIRPNKARQEFYDKRYQLYLQLLDTLDPFWDQIKNL
ncbi:FGGY-family carbohydrate kinase [uncultured Sphaerochaeta sp.]|uniref:FGGY-family carbohydrate kinase n=1 Tax=uncultured Sphaerochaeta sp. TaxID=886478 RepID=UPI002A0A3E2D|nr:FGGY-family carbohydrate kinase [uncultured Sphaerochaeta sp.]